MIFDFNGVLVDDEHVHFELFREVLATEGIALDEAAYHDRYLGFDDRGCFSAALADAGRAAPPSFVDDLIARKAARYAEVAEAGLRFFPSAAETLAAPGRRLSGRDLLRRAPGRDRVRAPADGRPRPRPVDHLGRGHRALQARPRGLSASPSTASAADLPDLDAGSCLVIEDSLAGIEAARAAGMVAVGVTHTYRRDELEGAGAAAVVEGLGTITPGWLRNIGRESTAEDTEGHR